MATASLSTATTTAQPTTSTNNNDLTILIGLSGPSSSGKTTIARLLAQIFTQPSITPSPSPTTHTHTRPFASSSLHILHQDDFYLTDALVPLITTPADSLSGLGSRALQDWDCASSLDVGLLQAALGSVKSTGRLPEGSSSKEDENSVGFVDVREETVAEGRRAVEGWLRGLGMGEQEEGGRLVIWLVDGFLLYPPPPPAAGTALAEQRRQSKSEDERMRDALYEKVTRQLDVKLLLLSSREQTIARRTRRTGYVTLEGFWEDPPGYVEDVVWPNYVRDAGWLMRSRSGEGVDGKGEDEMVDVDEEVAQRERIRFVPGKGKADLNEVLEWAVGEVMRGVERVVGEQRRDG